jgi:lipopolysaccharide export system permease protein
LIILQKYLLREWFWTFLAVTVVLIIVLFGVAVGELLNDVAGGRVPPGLLGSLLLLKSPDLLNKILPLAIFIAVIWGLGRLYRDQEMSVMRSSGFSWQMMLRPLFNLLLPVAALVLLVGVFISPLASKLAQEKLEYAFRTAAEWGLQTGRFHVLQNGNLILYVETVEADGRSLRNIFIQQRRADREQIWVAEQGYYWLDVNTGMRYLTMENGQITEGGRESLDFGVVRFSRNDLRLPDPEDRHNPDGVETKSSSELIFSDDAAEAAEFQWRISPALAIIVLGFLAIPLSHHEPREGRGGRIMLGIFAYIIYANLLYMSRSWTANGSMPVVIGTWWVHVLVLLIAIIWLRRQGRAV